MSNGMKGIKKDIYKMKYKTIFAMALIYALVFTTCSNLFESSDTLDSVKPGYGIIRISTDNKAMRTSFPSITPFERYDYTFTKVTADSEPIGEAETIEPVDGVFTLEVGYYIVSINAFIAEDHVYPAANGVSAIFQVNADSNETLIVPLAFITDFENAAQGTLIYIIKYPLGADIDLDSFTLRKWTGTEDDPEYEYIALSYEPLDGEENDTQEVTQTIQLDAGFYVFNIFIEIDGKYAGTVEAAHIYPASTTLVEIIFDREGLVTTAVYGIELSETGIYLFDPANYGYSTQTPLSVSVSNTGNQATDELTVALSGENANNFTLSTTSLGSITVNGNGTFTVKPETGLDVGTYTGTVTVSGGNDINTQFSVSFTVSPVPITTFDIHITAPVKGGIPSATTTATDTMHFISGNVTWLPNDNPFLGGGVYTTTVTLTANNGYTFSGLGDAKINGQEAAIINNNGETATISYTFPATLTKEVTGLTIKTQPDRLSYTHGESLDLTGIVVTFTYDDTSTEDVGIDDFITKGITTIPAHDDILSHSVHDNQSVTAEQGSHTADTNNLIVNKAPAPSVTWPTATAITYGATLSASALTSGSTAYGSFAWTNGTIVPTVTNSGYSVTFTPNQDMLANYEITTMTNVISITVNKATQAALTIDAVGTKTYGDILFTLSTNGGNGNGTMTFNTTSGNDVISIDGSTVTILKAGTATVTATKADDGNYYSADSSAITITVNKATGVVVTPELVSKTHNSITVIGTAAATGQTVQFAINNTDNVPVNGWQDSRVFTSLSANTSYYVFARTIESANYTGVTGAPLKVTTSQSGLTQFAYYWVDEHDKLVINDGVSFTIQPDYELEITALDGESGYTVLRWYVNGTLIDHDRNSYLFSSVEPGTHNVGLVVVKDGKYYNTNISITVLGN